MTDLFVVPPYLVESGGARGRERFYSYIPLVVAEPAAALEARTRLDGARLFDEAAQHMRAQNTNFPDALPVLAGLANLCVNAVWTAPLVVEVQGRWRRSPALATATWRPGDDLSDGLPADDILRAIEKIVADVVGVGDATLSKALALAYPGLFPMLDSYVERALWGGYVNDTDNDENHYLGWYLRRFRRLLAYCAPVLRAVRSPSDLQYSNTEKLDRLLWLGIFGAAFYAAQEGTGVRWTAVTGLPREHLLSAESGIGRVALRHARVVVPSTGAGARLEPGEVVFADLSPRHREFVSELLAQAWQQAKASGCGCWPEGAERLEELADA